MRRILLARFSDPEELYHAQRDTLENLDGITKEALDALGELTGRTAREEIVSRIFERFCVGK